MNLTENPAPSRYPRDQRPYQLAVIIPTLNEADCLPSLLAQLQQQRGLALELIVADGGSHDGTQEIATSAQAKLVTSEAGRGRQMNRGAARASAPLLLFLHADSSLPEPGLLVAAVEALQQAWNAFGHQRVAGHFRLRFQRNRAGRDLTYRYYEEKSALNRAECTNGDQGFLLAKDFFTALGGFDESLGFLEDQRLAALIRRQGRWITLPGELVTSARRFEVEGLGRRMLLSALIMNFHAIGVDEFLQHSALRYRQQDSTGRLQLGPVFALIDQLNQAAGPQVRRQRWLATGRYVCGHLWQPWLFLDVLLGSKGKRFLQLHDLLFKPLGDFRPLHYLTAGVVWLCYLGVRAVVRYRGR